MVPRIELERSVFLELHVSLQALIFAQMYEAPHGVVLRTLDFGSLCCSFESSCLNLSSISWH